MKHSVRFDADIPEGWSMVDPPQDGEANASAVFIRNEDGDSPRVPRIVITEHRIQSSNVDLKEFALEFAERMRKQVIGLEIVRSEYIKRHTPSEYGQEMEFILVSGVLSKLTHLVIAIPAADHETHLVEITFRAPKERYSACSGEFGDFLKSLRLATDGTQ